MELDKEFKGYIDDNKDVLLSVFGYDGLLKSKLKSSMIKTIILEVAKNHEEKTNKELVLEFFQVLKRVYMSDSQFKNFSIDEIFTLILEEQLFMLEEFEGE